MKNKNIVKIHNFTYASCKNTGLLLQDCMKAQDDEEKSQCLRAKKDREGQCAEEGGKRLCLQEIQVYESCADRGVKSCIEKLPIEIEKCNKMQESRFIKFSAPVCYAMEKNNRKICLKDADEDQYARCVEKDRKMTEECVYHRQREENPPAFGYYHFTCAELKFIKNSEQTCSVSGKTDFIADCLAALAKTVKACRGRQFMTNKTVEKGNQ